jgi:hypothetical protein
MDADKLHAGFVRNRRFLIAVSFALAAFHVLGLKFSQITHLGNTATLLHPERVELLGWCIWAWAFVQYVQWFRDVGAWIEFCETVASDCSQVLGQRKCNEYVVPDWAKIKVSENWGELPPGTQTSVVYLKRFSKINGDGRDVPRWADIEIDGTCAP